MPAEILKLFVNEKRAKVLVMCTDEEFSYFNEVNKIAEMIRVSERKEAEKYIPGTNAMVDCSSCFFTMTDERIMEFMNMYGEDRIMFGSDYPMWDAGTELARLRSLPLSKTALEKIQYKNAAEFLSL